MAALLGVGQSEVNPAITLRVVLAIRFAIQKILHIASVVCKWALGTSFGFANVAAK